MIRRATETGDRDVAAERAGETDPHVDCLAVAEVGVTGGIDGPHVEYVLARPWTATPAVEEGHVDGANALGPRCHLSSFVFLSFTAVLAHGDGEPTAVA